MDDKLFPAYQKFYSALNCMERFNKEQDFFDNISALDSFFSEYRNVTFVLQKSLAHTEYLGVYEKKRDKYLSDCRWLKDKRNETTKQHPFQLIKQVDISVYFPFAGMKVLTKQFLVGEDMDLSVHRDELKVFLSRIDPVEVFFSAEFSFLEEGSDIDVFDQILFGVQQMLAFLNAMYFEIGEKSELCEKLRKKISELKTYKIPRDMLLINDYVYYPNQERFERGARVAMQMGANDGIGPIRASLTTLKSRPLFQATEDDCFRTFILMHVLIGRTDIMPVFMLIYDDDTFELDPFHSDIKTTMYRKINEVAQRIQKQNIKSVYFMSVYTICDFQPERLQMSSKERAGLAKDDILVFAEVDDELKTQECCFDGKMLQDKYYVADRLFNHVSNKLEMGKVNMIPIIQAFLAKKVASEK